MDSLKGTNLNRFRVWMTALWTNQQFTGNVLKHAHGHSHYFLWYRCVLFLAFTVYCCCHITLFPWCSLLWIYFPMRCLIRNCIFFIQKIISCSQFNCSTYLLFETDGCYFANETCALRSDFYSSNQWMNMCSFPFFNENQHVRELSDIQQSACVCQQQTNNLNVFSLEFNMTKWNIS